MIRFWIAFIGLILASSTNLAQEITEAHLVKATISENELDHQKTDTIPQKSVVTAGEKFKLAQKNYANAQKNYENARAAYKKSMTTLDAARREQRQAERELTATQKIENPIIVNRFDVNVNPIYEKMSQGSQYGAGVFLLGSEKGGITSMLSSNAESEFKKFLKKYAVKKVRRRKGELVFEGISIPDISPVMMDIYTDFEKQDNGVVLKTFYHTVDGFLNMETNGRANTGITNLLDRFARHTRYVELEKELSEQEKELEKLIKSLEKTQENKTKAYEAITENENEIGEINGQLTQTETLIDQQREVIELTRKKLGKVN